MDSRLYSRLPQETIYQGDGIQNLQIQYLPQPQTKPAPGIILSNTCDISPENPRPYPIRVLYAPLIKLQTYRTFLEKAWNTEKIAAHISDLRKQRITQIFFVPSIGEVEDSLVLLDRVISNSITAIPQPLSENRIFSLSQYGHYLFLFKLSLHFTRMAEGVDRDDSTL